MNVIADLHFAENAIRNILFGQCKSMKVYANVRIVYSNKKNKSKKAVMIEMYFNIILISILKMGLPLKMNLILNSNFNNLSPVANLVKLCHIK